MSRAVCRWPLAALVMAVATVRRLGGPWAGAPRWN